MKQPSLFDEDALERARRIYFDRIEAGRVATCPCCDRRGRIYRRKLHAEMARFLVLLVAKTAPGEWLHIRKVIGASGAKVATDGAYLVHWGLVEKADDLDDVRTRGGLYRASDKGRRFATGELTVPSHVVLYDNGPRKLEGDEVSIFDALGDRFDYRELIEESARGVARAEVSPAPR